MYFVSVIVTKIHEGVEKLYAYFPQFGQNSNFVLEGILDSSVPTLIYAYKVLKRLQWWVWTCSQNGYWERHENQTTLLKIILFTFLFL